MDNWLVDRLIRIAQTERVRSFGTEGGLREDVRILKVLRYLLPPYQAMFCMTPPIIQQGKMCW
jgi:hypothetical protein